MTETNLIIPIETTPALLFTNEGTATIIKEIEKKVKEFKGSIDTDKNRKGIASFAYKIAQTKTFLEKLGKDLVSGEKAKLKLVDAERKKLRDSLSALAARAREPLTEYENAEKARIEAERQLEIFNLDHEEALQMDDLFNREKELAKKEAELAKQEEERKQKEEAERLEKEKLEREERIKKEAAERAQREAEEEIQAEKDRAEKIKQDAIEAEKQAEIEKERAVQKAKDDAKAEQDEKDRKIAEAKAMEDRKAANKNHQKRINREALADLMTLVDEEKGIEIITAIATHQIRHTTINY